MEEGDSRGVLEEEDDDCWCWWEVGEAEAAAVDGGWEGDWSCEALSESDEESE